MLSKCVKLIYIFLFSNSIIFIYWLGAFYKFNISLFNVIQLIEQVAQDIKFEQHRTVLIRAYGLFVQAINRLRSAMQLQDISRRNAEIDAARGMLFEALADYTNPHLLAETCAPGQLRRLECSWAIEQAIITTYQIQNEVSAVSDS